MRQSAVVLGAEPEAQEVPELRRHVQESRRLGTLCLCVSLRLLSVNEPNNCVLTSMKSDIANQFLERMEQFLDMKDEARRKREEQQLQAISDGHHHRHHHHQRRSSAGLRYGDNNADADDETKTWEEVQDEFLGRVQLDLMHRALSKDAILHELQRECSFTPSISTKAKRVRHSNANAFGVAQSSCWP